MNYIVYITINLCNGKFYIGVHYTNPNIFDGYIGCGIYRQSNATKNIPFHNAVRKYGYQNFKRTTIKIFEDSEYGRKEAYSLERILVNSTLLKSKNVYNSALGGFGSIQEETSKTVYMYDLKGEYLRSFKSTREAARYISNDKDQEIVRTGIKNNCAGRSNSCNGFYFSYKKEFGYNNNCMKQVAQYTLSGKYLRYYSSITEAEQELKLNSIQQAIKKQYQCGGYQWRYFTGDTSDIPKLLNTFTKLHTIPIQMFNKNGEFIAEYNSVVECQKANPELKVSQISRVLKGIIKSHKGYTFKMKIQSNDSNNNQND